MKIYIGGLPYQSDSDDVRAMFTPYGEVTDVKVISDRETGRSKGFGFVEMSDETAQKAIEGLHETHMQGRTLTVNEAKPMATRGGGEKAKSGYAGMFGNRRY